MSKKSMPLSEHKRYIISCYKDNDTESAKAIYKEYKKNGGKSTFNAIVGKTANTSKRKPTPIKKTPINRDPTLTEWKQMVKSEFHKGNMDLAYNNYKQYSREGGKASFESVVGSNKYKTQRTKYGYKIKRRWFK